MSQLTVRTIVVTVPNVRCDSAAHTSREMYHFLDDVLNINSTFSPLLLAQRVWAFYVIFYINFSFMGEMLSSAADSSFPRHMKEQKIKIKRAE